MSLSDTKLNRVLIAGFLLAVVSLLVYVACRSPHESIFSEYGWQVISGGSRSSWTFVMDESFLACDINQRKINASKDMGLDPTSYQGKTIVIYQYMLGEIGLDRNLMGQIWLHKNKLICAFIFHVEPNRTLFYWPLDAELSSIRDYLMNN